MAIWSMTAPRISGPSVAAAPFGRWMNNLQRQASDYGYAFAVTLAAVVAIVALPDTRPSTDLVFAPLALALFAGFLLTVRLAPGRPSAALVLLPAMAVDARRPCAGAPNDDARLNRRCLLECFVYGRF